MDPEWSDLYLTPEKIQEGNPLGHQLFINYINKFISKPSIDKLNSMYKENNNGSSGYIADTILETSNSSSEKSFGILIKGVPSRKLFLASTRRAKAKSVHRNESDSKNSPFCYQ